MNFLKYIKDQFEWSLKTFGPGKRTESIIAHIKKEFEEIKAKPDDPNEWLDVVSMAIDGACRAGYSPQQIGARLDEKLGMNIQREWPDWREVKKGKPIEHVRDKLKELDEKMKKAGMIPVSELLKNHPANPFIVHAGMKDLEFFREWLHMRHKEYVTMQAKMTLEASSEHDEMFEWVLAHSAVFGEVIANFDAAVKKH